jgi:hypothetical protein
MPSRFEPHEIEGLLLALGDLIETGDIGAARSVVWISYSLAQTHGDLLGTEQQVTLAQTAARAAEHGSSSLVGLAVRLIDPLLDGVSQGLIQLDAGTFEELNAMRNSLGDRASRHQLPAHAQRFLKS